MSSFPPSSLRLRARPAQVEDVPGLANSSPGREWRKRGDAAAKAELATESAVTRGSSSGKRLGTVASCGSGEAKAGARGDRSGEAARVPTGLG